jgi:hypothetical protein
LEAETFAKQQILEQVSLYTCVDKAKQILKTTATKTTPYINYKHPLYYRLRLLRLTLN